MRFTDPEFVERLRDLDVPVGEKLGHGAYGIVFTHRAARDRVIKITTGLNEANTARWLMRHTMLGTSPHVCLPAVYSVTGAYAGVLGHHYRGPNAFWVYEREALANWSRNLNNEMVGGQPCQDRPCLDGYYRAYGILFDAVEISTQFNGRYGSARDIARREFEAFTRSMRTIHGRDLAAARRAIWACKQTVRDLGSTVRSLLDFADWALDHGVLLTDIHIDNWGQRANGEKVVRDIGGISIATARGIWPPA